MTSEPVINPLDVLGAGAGGPLPPSSPWSDFGSYLQYLKGIVIGNVAYMGNGMINANGYYINGVAFNFTTLLPIAGGTLTGPLVLSGDPTAPFQAATKNYVDNQVAVAGNGRFLALTGGTLTGALILNADPTLPLGSSTKQYVDGRTPITTDAPNNANYYVRYQNSWQVMPAGITIADAPSDGNTYARNNLAWTSVYDAGAY